VSELTVGDGLVVRFVKITELREQDVNAQVMQPREQERLTENVRERGALESFPYCAQPDGEGPVEIISGHHRVRAARAAGLTEIPVIIDTHKMTRSRIVAKQIAHNALVGSPDEDVLRQLIASMDSVDDLLHTGLPDEMLPVPDPEAGQVQLGTPHADFDWRYVLLTFLPHQLDDLQKLVDELETGQDLVGAAPVECFADFARAMRDYGRAKNVKSMGTTVATLTKIALEQLGVSGEDTVGVETVLGTDRLPAELGGRLAHRLRELAGDRPAWEALAELLDAAEKPRRRKTAAATP
jgi:hypothetical protein